MNLPFDERVKLAKEELLPIFAKYQVDIGSEHFQREHKNPTKLIDFFGSNVKWIDKAESEKTNEKGETDAKAE